jgi:hypothetical protein
MNSENLILNMGEEVIFAHNQMAGFLSNTSFNTNSLFVAMVIFKNEHCKIQFIWMKQSIHPHPIFSHFSSIVVGNLDHNQTIVEIILGILQVFSLEVQIDHT